MNQPCKLGEMSKGIVVHHWDADGIASAAMLVRIGVAIDWLTPRIGSYSAEAIPVKEIQSHDGLVYVLDYGVPGREYSRLASVLRRPLVVIDHHRVEAWKPLSSQGQYCNPVAQGVGSERDYPATAFVLYKVLSKPRALRDLAVIGVVGDTAAWLNDPDWQDFINKLSGGVLSLGEAEAIVKRIDSCHKLFDHTCTHRAVLAVAEEPRGVLEDPYYDKALKRIEELNREVEKALKPISETGFVRVYELILDAYVTGHVGRQLAVGHDGVIVLVHWIPRLNMGFIYVRSRKYDLSPIASELRRRGYRVGGKDYVFVVEYSKHPPREIVEEIVETIRDKLGALEGQEGG